MSDASAKRNVVQNSPQESRPLCAIYVAWHPSLPRGGELAKHLYDHYRRDLFANVAGGVGLSVLYRSAPRSSTQTAPIDVPLDDAHVSVVLLLLSEHIVQDAAWRAYVEGLLGETRRIGLTSRVIPIAVDGAGLELLAGIQAIRAFEWHEQPGETQRVRLVSAITYELCRMMRTYLAHEEYPDKTVDELEVYLRKACVFLSHSKHDRYGEEIAGAIRSHIFENNDLASFMDVHNIPAGLAFADVLVRFVRTSAVVAIYTDSYSSREWCRREIIEAKRSNVPLIVADCITDVDERGFPYMGNVPIVRMEPEALERIPHVIARLLDEIFKDYLWKARTWPERGEPNVVFLPRPPELIALASVALSAAGPSTQVVYPDPPLGVEEVDVFAAVKPGMVFRSYSDWAAEHGGTP